MPSYDQFGNPTTAPAPGPVDQFGNPTFMPADTNSDYGTSHAPAPSPTPAPSPAPTPAPAPYMNSALAPAPSPNPQQQMLTDWYDSYMMSNPSAQGYTAAQADTTNWTVDPNQTVQGQLTGMLAKDSPLMTMAQTRSDQQMNRRGLMSSSMAVGAGQAALYDAAVPIATSDASMFGRAGETNANNANTNARFNTGETNTATRFGADANNQAKYQQRDAGVRAGIQAQEQGWQSGENTTQRNWGTTERLAGQDFTSGENTKTRDQTTSENATNRAFTTSERQASEAYTAWQNQETRAFSKSERVEGQQFTASQTAAQQAFQTAFQSADFAGRQVLTNIDNNVKIAVANINGRFNLQMQGSSSMSATFNAMNNGIAAILTNPDLDWAGKQAAINALVDSTNNTLGIQSALLGIDLGTLSSTTLSGVDTSGTNNNGGGTNSGTNANNNNGSGAATAGTGMGGDTDAPGVTGPSDSANTGNTDGTQGSADGTANAVDINGNPILRR